MAVCHGPETTPRIKLLAFATVLEEMRPLVTPDIDVEMFDFGRHLHLEGLREALQSVADGPLGGRRRQPRGIALQRGDARADAGQGQGDHGYRSPDGGCFMTPGAIIDHATDVNIEAFLAAGKEFGKYQEAGTIAR